MGEGEFDFGGYLHHRGQDVFGGDGGSRYAYAADLAMLRMFRRVRPVEMAAASAVRAYKDVLRNQYLGTTVRVGKKQFTRIHRLVEECAEVLGVGVPTVYVANSPFINAYTFGTDDDSMIVLHSALIDHFTETELKFVIGHETGHIQNKHVVYGTVLRLLKSSAGLFVRWVIPPAEVALSAWARRAEITCDRAGLLCCRDLDAATRTFVKLASGSQKLYAEIDVESYLEQLQEASSGIGRFQEAMSSHPYLPKRLEALRLFSESELYREASGQGAGGLDMVEVDERTSEIIQIVKSPRAWRRAGGAREE